MNIDRTIGKGVKIFDIKPYTSDIDKIILSPFSLHYIQIDKPSTLINYLFVFYVLPFTKNVFKNFD